MEQAPNLAIIALFCKTYGDRLLDLKTPEIISSNHFVFPDI